MTKISDLEWYLTDTVNRAVQELELANENKDFKTLREVLKYGFGDVHVYDDFIIKNGFEEEHFAREDLDRKVRYLGLDSDTDSIYILKLRFVN